MVDSRTGTGMTEGGRDTRLKRVERKLDDLTASVDVRFGAVDEAITEQRRYAEFAFDRRLSEMTLRFSEVNADLAAMKADLSGVKADISGMKVGFANVDVRFNRLERKLDRFIQMQAKTNKLVERRLDTLERR
jgi:hypothetical protein